MKYYKVETSPISTKNEYVVMFKDNLFDIIPYIYGSAAVINARLLGLTYAQYLKWCRDVYNARLVGSKSLYVVPYYANKDDAAAVASELDRRLIKVFSEERL